MASVRQVTAVPPGARRRWLGAAAVLAAVPLALGTGCVTSRVNDDGSTTQLPGPKLAMPAVFGGGGDAQVTQLVAQFSPRLEHLPNPRREGMMCPGVVAEAFLLAADSSPVNDVPGTLTVMAWDATPRAGGAPPRTPEAWQFDPATLKKLRNTNERFGKGFALFLPWPPEWTDVSHVRVQAVYEQDKGPKLYSADHTVTIDFSTNAAQGWKDKGTTAEAAARTAAFAEKQGIPDFKKVMAGPGTTGVVPAGGVVPQARPTSVIPAAMNLPGPVAATGTMPTAASGNPNAAVVPTSALPAGFLAGSAPTPPGQPEYKVGSNGVRHATTAYTLPPPAAPQPQAFAPPVQPTTQPMPQAFAPLTTTAGYQPPPADMELPPQTVVIPRR